MNSQQRAFRISISDDNVFALHHRITQLDKREVFFTPFRIYEMDSGTNSPIAPWYPGAKMFSASGTLNGRSNHDRLLEVVKTADQILSAAVNITAYKLSSPNTQFDFYAVYGLFEHGVENFGKNVVSVGYYATSMELEIELNNPIAGVKIWDQGPTSTVGESTTSFNIGGNLSGGVMAGEPILQAGVSASFGTSFSSPSVTIDGSVQNPDFSNPSITPAVNWKAKLPGVGYSSPGVPANPEAPSSSGYSWYFGAIFVVPAGGQLSLTVLPKVVWEFDYTRGITNDTKTWQPTDAATTVYTFE